MDDDMNELDPSDGLWYLASPYSHELPEVREERFHLACRASAGLMKRGWLIFSPIAHTHPIAQHGLPKGWDFWEKYDIQFLNACVGIIVLQIDGWEASKGIEGELRMMDAAGKAVRYMTLEDC